MQPKKQRAATIFHHYSAQIIACIVSLFLLIYFFRTPQFNNYDIWFFSTLSIVALFIADFFYRHEHKLHDASVIGGLFFFPPLMTAVLFSSTWAWVLLGVVILALVGALFVHYHHKKGKHLTEVTWVSVYSHLIALGAALLTFALMSYIQLTAHVSMVALIFIYLAPPALVHFFVSHYMYVHHFDSKHTTHDIVSSLKYALIFTAILSIVLSSVYVGLNISNAEDYKEDLIDSLNYDMGFYTALESSMDFPPADLENVEVYSEVKSLVSEANSKLFSYQDTLFEADFSMLGFIRDEQYEAYVDWFRGSMERYVDQAVLSNAKMRMDEWSVDTPKTSLRKEDVYLSYLPDTTIPGAATLKEALYSVELSPVVVVEDIYPALIAASNIQGGATMYDIVYSDNYASERVNAVYRNSKTYLASVKMLAVLVFDIPEYVANHPINKVLEKNIDKYESQESKQLRYLLLLDAADRQQAWLNPKE